MNEKSEAKWGIAHAISDDKDKIVWVTPLIAWRTIAGFELYEVSNTGLVRRKLDKVVLMQSPTHNGYLRVVLWRDGVSYNRRVHLLVLHAWAGAKPTARHVGAHAPDRDQANNQICNLRWALPEDNEADKVAHGTVKNGPKTTLTKRQVGNIRKCIAGGKSDTFIATAYGVHRHTISRIRRGLRHATVNK